MITKIALALLALAIVTPAAADSGVRRAPCGYQQIATLTTAVGLTIPPACGNQATLAVITPEAQAVRYRDDGTDPTASIGMPMAVGVTLNYEGTLSKIKFIEQTVGGKLNVSYYR
jgi:hypothetical protein